MLDPQLNQKISAAYVRIGDLGYTIAKNLFEGEDYTAHQKNLWNKGLAIQEFEKLLLRHVNNTLTPPVLYNATEAQIHKILRCLESVGDLEVFPIYPTLLNNAPPVVFNQGKDGIDGQDGLDADIIVEPEVGETQIEVTSVVITGVKHYRINFVPYIVQSLSVSIPGPKIYETGSVVSKVVSLTSTKGSALITSLTMTDSDLNNALQLLVNLGQLNGVTQPVTYQVNANGLSVSKVFEGILSDSTNSIHSSDQIQFFYPFLSAATDGTTITYGACSKVIIGKSNVVQVLNGTNKYFWLGYDASYGPVARIRDQNGFDVTSGFTPVTVSITSVGLTVNWTRSFQFYRTISKTDINNKPYTLEF